eukprot:7798831-Alexandrium_andersonii.AAC.1
MSASLVGSEMCIRDRVLGPRSSRSERLKRFCVFAWRIADSGGLQPWRAPVSYTHLTLPTICSV